MLMMLALRLRWNPSNSIGSNCGVFNRLLMGSEDVKWETEFSADADDARPAVR